MKIATALALSAAAVLIAGCGSSTSVADRSTATSSTAAAPTTTSTAVTDANFIVDVRGIRGYSLGNTDASLVDLGRTTAKAFESISDSAWNSTYTQVRDILVESGMTKDFAKQFILSSVKYFAPSAAPQTQRMARDVVELRTNFSAGVYIAGTDIEPGRYKTEGASRCYFEVRRDPTGSSVSNIIDNDNLDGPGYLSVAQGQGVKVSGTCVFQKVG